MMIRQFLAKRMGIPGAVLLAALMSAASPAQAALPPGAEEERIEARRASAPEELLLRVESAEVESKRRFGFFGGVVKETHTLRGTIASAKRSEAGLEAGSPFVLRIVLDVARIERERRAHRRELRRGRVGPQVYFMAAPVFSEGPPSEENAYAMPAWTHVEEGVLLPGAGPHSFGRSTLWADSDHEDGDEKVPENERGEQDAEDAAGETHENESEDPEEAEERNPNP